VSTVYDNPPRSTSSRSTAKRASSPTSASTIATRTAAGRGLTPLLERLRGRRDEEHAFEPEPLGGVGDHEQVPDVRRVERAAEHTHPPVRRAAAVGGAHRGTLSTR
jgi:hypothetical protein